MCAKCALENLNDCTRASRLNSLIKIYFLAAL